MKRFTLTMICLATVSMASAATSSNLKLVPFNSGKLLGTVKLNHFGSNPGYYRIVFKFAKTDGHISRTTTARLTGVYNKFFDKNYIVDAPDESAIETITDASASISFESCTDKTFSSCSIIKQQDIKVDFNGSTITAISPNNFDVTV